jgi:hypothetical protein
MTNTVKTKEQLALEIVRRLVSIANINEVITLERDWGSKTNITLSVPNKVFDSGVSMHFHVGWNDWTEEEFLEQLNSTLAGVEAEIKNETTKS